MKRIPFILLGILLLLVPCFAGASEVYDPASVYPVTKAELVDFLASDNTSEHEYTAGYRCVQFSVDFWHNCYLNGIDAFLILINTGGLSWHMVVGVSATGRDAYPEEYWGDSEKWFFVDPQHDGLLSRGNNMDTLDKGNWNIVGYVRGRDALDLWDAIDNGMPILPLVKINGFLCLCKLRGLIK